MAIPRPYQDESVDLALAHLVRNRAATLVLPTGAGKTAIAGFAVQRIAEADPDARFLVLQQTEELLDQNLATISAIAGLPCSVVMGRSNDWSGDVVFASVPTLSRAPRLVDMRSFTHLIVDECQHSAAETWLRVILRARRANPKLRIVALSATPDRADGKPLPKLLGRIVHRVRIQELIDLGHLVPPRAFSVVMDDAVERIARLRGRDAGSGDQTEVARILDTPAHNAAVVSQWMARAYGRPTIAFCSTVEHARHVAQAFVDAGIPASAVDHRDREGRRRAIEDYRAGRVTVLVNCLLLTEGFDHTPTSCIIVLRAMLHLSTFVQALGRSLRTVDAMLHPGVVKTDAVCLDFSGAAARHRALDDATTLPVAVVELGDLERSEEPVAAEAVDRPEDAFLEPPPPVLEEIDLSTSQFRWTDIHGDGRTIVVSGLAGYAAVCPARDQWVAFGRSWDGTTRLLHRGARRTAFAAGSDWIRRIETDDRAVGSRRWLDERSTAPQRRMLVARGYRREDADAMGRYEASCHIVYVSERDDAVRAVRSYLDLCGPAPARAAAAS